jgi:hypothetical protein
MLHTAILNIQGCLVQSQVKDVVGWCNAGAKGARRDARPGSKACTIDSSYLRHLVPLISFTQHAQLLSK